MITKETSALVVQMIVNLVVRLIGLAFLYQGLTAVPTAASNFSALGFHYFGQSLLRTFFLVGWPLVLAWWMVRGAPWLMRLAFREAEPISSTPI